MPNIRLDYIWLDGYQPTANIRTKSQMLDADSFDGSLAAVPGVGLRRQLDATGGGTRLRLHSETRAGVSESPSRKTATSSFARC